MSGPPASRTAHPLQWRVLEWFRRNRRELPWRTRAARRDAYRIWISEVMLQQTRVAAAIPYYQRFLRRFPTVWALARARENEVLRHWAGLGYYGRARNLHRAAKEIVRRHEGHFPHDYGAALALPGVGRYTAAAVLSIAHGEPLAVLDGNVARFLARLYAIRGDVRAPRRWRQLQARAQELLTPEAPGDWNAAMMELGARVCTPRVPRCGECPLARWCRARALGIQDKLPGTRRMRATEKLRIAAAVLLDARGRTLLVRRTGGLFSGLWQFPATEVRRDAHRELLAALMENSPQRTQRALRKVRNEKSLAERGISDFGCRNVRARVLPLRQIRHAVTHRDITLAPFLLRVKKLPQLDGARVLPLARIDRLPVSSATRKIAAVALEATGR